ncbi:hypothetical protein M9458_057253 [Cirrhinus mrigala]|uniref:Integrase catalytic domain-containing protein n=1 Tax=Cirrhinus mrigala TaxID=683832 RepID=A0ABD0MF02_CIRMR
MALYDNTIGLESFLQRTTRVSQRLPVPEPMQGDSTRLTCTERNQRLLSGLCLYCGNNGHFICNCPIKPPRPLVSTVISEVEITNLTLIPVTLHTSERSISVSALINSVPTASTRTESPEPKVTPEIPAEYRAFQDVFSKPAATQLPPHWPWDCAIELLPGAQLPKGKIYPLFIPEWQAMEEYITEALQQGFIQPSTLPTASSFFFLGKKDGVLTTEEELRGACVFSKLDLRSAYNTIASTSSRSFKNSVNIVWPGEERHDRARLRLNFKITYRPGTKNVTADALSRQFSADSPAEPETILPPDLIISPIVWDLDQNIRNGTLQEPAPPGCPEGKIYVPHSQRLNLLGTTHESLGSGHPGSRRTFSLLQAQYWYVQSCSVCAMSNTPRHLSTEKLVPLPIPQRPWSHIGVDFVTNLPNSEGNTCILVTLDRFSKSCKLIPLKGLPTALETAEHLLQHVFRNFGLPEENFSDRAPQFISHIWKAFFKLLGISVNLSSGYHPQTNGQTERKIEELRRYLWSYCQEDQYSWSRGLLTPEEGRHPNTNLGTKSGCPPVTCAFGYSPRYIGLFKILRRINDVTYQLQLPPRYHIHPTFHVSLLKPFSPSATETTGAEVEPPPSEVLDQPSIYLINEILDSRRRGGRLEYLVNWEGAIQIILPLAVVVTLDAMLGRQEPPLEKGHSPQPPPPSTSQHTRSQSPKY